VISLVVVTVMMTAFTCNRAGYTDVNNSISPFSQKLFLLFTPLVLYI